MKNDDERKRLGAYVEARLGAKALLTNRVGGGGNARVYELSSFQLRDSLKDGIYYFTQTSQNDKKSKMMMENRAEDIVESLAACVEFDGLETTTDPSPRSSLMTSMYTDQKATYVKRLLSERVLPACDDFVKGFGYEIEMRCVDYVRSTYPSEYYSSLRPNVDSTEGKINDNNVDNQ
eukprot:CAMPEP_0195533918 /NCGR_PEP_ID=MMETSP0794_2-20130614/41459_1 /TAXON_ID=515487 /ORGANISM="Stephanopyxis turris, Strain CCMP 815" /LENGTH=176 /DNA_ID=CAMNT_0040666603 /DNA_START=336 /DNA_END=866 /DNA_ORIENTATION=-